MKQKLILLLVGIFRIKDENSLPQVNDGDMPFPAAERPAGVIFRAGSAPLNFEVNRARE